MADIIIERMRSERSREGALKQTLGGLWIPDTNFSCVTLERPYIRNLPSVSRLPKGIYSYKVINKTPTSNLAKILVLNTDFSIGVVGSYVDAVRTIMVGEEYVEEDTCYNLSNQRKVLSNICKQIPEKGTIEIK